MPPRASEFRIERNTWCTAASFLSRSVDRSLVEQAQAQFSWRLDRRRRPVEGPWSIGIFATGPVPSAVAATWVCALLGQPDLRAARMSCTCRAPGVRALCGLGWPAPPASCAWNALETGDRLSTWSRRDLPQLDMSSGCRTSDSRTSSHLESSLQGLSLRFFGGGLRKPPPMNELG